MNRLLLKIWPIVIWCGLLLTAILGVYAILCMIMPAGTQLMGSILTRDLTPQMAVLVGGIGAIAGWITTAYIVRIGSIKQHTMNFLTQVRLSAEMGYHLRELNKAYPGSSPVPSADVQSATRTEDWWRAAFYILNHYEFLAVAMRYGDMHEPVVKDCVRSIFLHTFNKLSHIIEFAVRSDSRTPGARTHIGPWQTNPSRIYKDIRQLRDKWDDLK
jgi:hypothetical protein